MKPIFKDVVCPECGVECQCGDQERALRAVIARTYPEPLTKEQREWCANEADSAGEGSYDAAKLLELSDVDLAVAVLRRGGIT